ncbi:transmembrane protein, putative (macronuclear) [Tetrahymena thermophila SB210]|uniref:Transmembrane protein, putative n=1 Tax=Tetrahymena thermophila (strain SB210) TaxID=312017 RepID=I7LZL0_TETTS|nr:transmembrane protein, putative [Tetrahymena thermophila SB210]EAR84131.1 transmembrane protein, putative [Tetrahymena thermophila SB210]|eukprot:XP_001031794.1 transmembrane protein, putative [Tetrahymena thermophila SB210]
MNAISRKESSDQGSRNQVQIKAWRKKNSSQISDFQSLYGSLNQSLNDEQINDFRLNRNTNSGSNPNNSSSINRNSSGDESFYSVNSNLQDNIMGSVSEKDKEDLRDEDFKSIKDNNSMISFNQVNFYQAANNNFSGKTNQDEDKELNNSILYQGFHTPKNQSSLENENDNFKLSQEIKHKQNIYKISNTSQRHSDVHSNYQQQNYQIYGKSGRYSQQPINRPHNYHINGACVNQKKSDTSSQDDYSHRSSVYNTNHPFMQTSKNQQEESRRSIGQPLLAENSQRKQKNSVQFNEQTTQNSKMQNKYQSPSIQGKINDLKGNQSESQRQLLERKNKVNRGKSLSTLKKMMQQDNSQQQNQEDVDANQFNYYQQNNQQENINLGQNNYYQNVNKIQNSNYSNQDYYIMSRQNTIQSHQRIKSQSRSTQQNFSEEHITDQILQKNSSSNFKLSLDRSENSNYEKQLQQFLYYERLRKKQKFRLAHNNRLIERKKNDNQSKPLQEQKQSRITMNLTFLIYIILEKHPKLKYLLFLNHIIGAISRGFVYAILILISMRASQYFIIFGSAIMLTRLYYVVSMYYVLFYFEQKSVSFRKISKIFNSFFQLPSEYKKPVMSEMIDMINFNQRDQEEKQMKRKFIFCPVEINYLCLNNYDSRKKWNLFYLSNFIYQGIESIFLFPIVIAISVHYYEQSQVLLKIDFLVFSRYIIVGSVSIFFIFCLFILIYGNRNFKVL